MDHTGGAAEDRNWRRSADDLARSLGEKLLPPHSLAAKRVSRQKQKVCFCCMLRRYADMSVEGEEAFGREGGGAWERVGSGKECVM